MVARHPAGRHNEPPGPQGNRILNYSSSLWRPERMDGTNEGQPRRLLVLDSRWHGDDGSDGAENAIALD